MLGRLLSPYAESVFVVMRILVGILFAFHGMQKVFGVLNDAPPVFGSQLWIGGVIEIASGVLIAIGLYTVWAAFIASGLMAVAYMQFHWKLAFTSAFWPAINRGELALVYAFLFLYIACRGPGRASLDARRSRP